MSQSAPSLRPQDVCVLLQLVLTPGVPYRELARLTGQSVGEAHKATKRLEVSRLCLPDRREANRAALMEFLVSGVPYAFPGELGPEARGVPTAHSGPALEGLVVSDTVIVWPSVEGNARGLSLAPLCSSAPGTIDSSPQLYRWLTVVDALRVGRARERQRAREILEREIGVRASNG